MPYPAPQPKPRASWDENDQHRDRRKPSAKLPVALFVVCITPGHEMKNGGCVASNGITLCGVCFNDYEMARRASMCGGDVQKCNIVHYVRRLHYASIGATYEQACVDDQLAGNNAANAKPDIAVAIVSSHVTVPDDSEHMPRAKDVFAWTLIRPSSEHVFGRSTVTYETHALAYEAARALADALGVELRP